MQRSSLAALLLVASVISSPFELCGGFVEQPVWEPWGGGSLWEPSASGTKFTSLRAKVPTIDTCGDSLQTNDNGQKTWGGGKIYFATVISKSWAFTKETRAASWGLCQRIYPTNEGYFYLNVLHMGLSGKALLEASRSWQISWIGASGKHTGHVRGSDWHSQWEIGHGGKRMDRVNPSSSSIWSLTETDTTDALPMRAGGEVDRFTTKIETVKSGFRHVPIYFASIQFAHPQHPTSYFVVGGEQMIWSPERTSFTVSIAVQKCNDKIGCRSNFDEKTATAALRTGVSVAYLGIEGSFADQVYSMTHPGQKMETGSSDGKWAVSPLTMGPFDEVLATKVRTSDLTSKPIFFASVSSILKPEAFKGQFLDDATITGVTTRGFQVREPLYQT
jgi:hypothetical protein